MKIGDMVKVITVTGHPLGIVMDDKQLSDSHDPIVKVWMTNDWYITRGSFPFRPHQLEVLSEGR